uniref:Protein-S-isoprenylcysteine O-methyltransferase n=1 Tax=Alexandrium catenella TaxID=2925 RepID=A0A7S1W0F9_ALECA
MVEVHGLQGAKELNGRRGRIVAFVEETQRFGVKLEGEEETKAVKPANLKRLEAMGTGERNALEKQLADVVQRLKTAKDGSEERGTLQKVLGDLIQKLKSTEEEVPQAPPFKPPTPTKQQQKPQFGPQPAGPSTPLIIQPPPPPREQHHPLPPRQKEPPRETLEPRSQRATAYVPPAMASRGAVPPPTLPQLPPPRVPFGKGVPLFSDEHEYPDPTRAKRAGRVVVGALVCGIVVSLADLFPATWFIWTFLAVHLVGVVCLTDYSGESGLLALCATFGLHSGVALSEFLLWTMGRDGADSVGPWSALVFFASLLYFHSFWMECVTLPPDYITSISLFFPMFPAFNAAIAMSCAELFLEWRYFPEHKIWTSAVYFGVACMALGQALIARACRTAERNFWASCRNMPEDEEKPEDFVGLEIPDRRIVEDGLYRRERHPAYLGAMLWGVGAEIALCNPFMLIVVGFVLWASLLHVALEEEQELYDEFKGSYANYSALTGCHIPFFDSLLESAAFQREMSDNCEEQDEDYDEELDEEEEDAEEDVASEDDMLPTWEGVPKGGALWNRQFREPWLLG